MINGRAVSWFIICDELANPTINFPVAKNWDDMGGDIRLINAVS